MRAAIVLFVAAGCFSPKPPVTTVEVEGPKGALHVSERTFADPPSAAGEHQEYLNSVQELLNPAWRDFLTLVSADAMEAGSPLRSQSLSCLLRLRLDEKGKVVFSEVEEPSGQSQFDAAALEVLRSVEPLPVPPVELVSDDSYVHLKWRFSADERQAGAANSSFEKIKWTADRAVRSMIENGRLDGAIERLRTAVVQNEVTPLQVAELMDKFVEGSILMSLQSGDAAQIQRGLQLAARGGFRDPTVQREILRFTAPTSSHREVAWRAVRGDTGQLLQSLQKNSTSPRIAAAIAVAIHRSGGATSLEVVSNWFDSENAQTKASALAVTATVPVVSAQKPLEDILRSSKSSRDEKMAACAGLGHLAATSNKVYSSLRRGLTAKDSYVRIECATAISQAKTVGKSRATYWIVVDMLKAKDALVRKSAVVAAARLEPVRFAADRRRLRYEKDTGVVREYAKALQYIRTSKDTVKLLHRFAKRKHQGVRVEAVRTLGIRSPSELTAYLQDSDPLVHATALARNPDITELRKVWAILSEAGKERALQELAAQGRHRQVADLFVDTLREPNQRHTYMFVWSAGISPSSR